MNGTQDLFHSALYLSYWCSHLSFPVNFEFLEETIVLNQRCVPCFLMHLCVVGAQQLSHEWSAAPGKQLTLPSDWRIQLLENDFM